MQENESDGARQYLTFVLGDERFALETSVVSEVLELMPITRIPRTPSFLRGVVNLRGNAATIVDLRVKFGMGRTESGVNACIIVVERDYDGEHLHVGILADAVEEVMEFPEGAMLETPDMGTAIEGDFLAGIARHEDDFIMVFNPEKLFALDELAARRS